MPNEFFFQLPTDEAIERIARRVVQLQREGAPEQQTTKPAAEEPVSIREVCALLRVSRPTLHSWMAKGTIPFHRKGRRVFLFKSEVLASLEVPKRLDGSAGARGISPRSTSPNAQAA